jgi:segregation and condensation protein A
MAVMTFEVRTPVFEGPLDLLLELITSHRLEVTELSLSDLVTEYVAHLDLMRHMDLEVTSEFLVIASTLIQLKARSLLPGAEGVDLDEDLLLTEERDRLLSRLLANLTFRDVAAVLAHRLSSAELMVGREVGFDADVELPTPPLHLGIGPTELAAIAHRVFTPVEVEPDLDHLDLDLPSVGEAMRDLRGRLVGDLETDFERLTDHLTRPAEVIAYFLALLELARWGLLRASQDEPGAPIMVTPGGAPAPVLMVSEFDLDPGGTE